MHNKDNKQNKYRGIAINPCNIYKVKYIAVYLLNINVHSNFKTYKSIILEMQIIIEEIYGIHEQLN